MLVEQIFFLVKIEDTTLFPHQFELFRKLLGAKKDELLYFMGLFIIIFMK